MDVPDLRIEISAVLLHCELSRSHFCLCKHPGRLSKAASCYFFFLLVLLLYRLSHYFLISFCGGRFTSGEAFCSVYALFTPSSLKTYLGVEESQVLRRLSTALNVC